MDSNALCHVGVELIGDEEWKRASDFPNARWYEPLEEPE